jgi:hypothetical protein
MKFDVRRGTLRPAFTTIGEFCILKEIEDRNLADFRAGGFSGYAGQRTWVSRAVVSRQA